MVKPDFLETARKALKQYYPDYQYAFVAGSMLRGEETPESDIDIVVIYDDTFENVHRNSVVVDGWPVEFFVHNCKSNDYYMDQDRKTGSCIMMHMIVSGIRLPEDSDCACERQAKARALIDTGPCALSDEEIEDRRYFITDSIDDLDKNRPMIERLGTLSRLYDQLGDFYLRTKGKWSGKGKSLGRALRQDSEVLAKEYEEAFVKAFQGDFEEIKTLANKLLSGYGGRCFEGYKRTAAKDW